MNDHPDRGAYGQWLEYPEGYDPIKISVEAMCDHWSEWAGMQHIVEGGRGTGQRREEDEGTLTLG